MSKPRKPASSKPYTGKLARPRRKSAVDDRDDVLFRTLGGGPLYPAPIYSRRAHDVDADGARDHEQGAEAEMMAALFEHYGIPIDELRGNNATAHIKAALGAFREIAYALAREHVPGFRIEEAPRGRPRRWSQPGKVALAVHIALLRRERRLYLDAAVREVAESPIWRDDRPTRSNAATAVKTFRRLAQDARPEYVERAQAFVDDKTAGTIDDRIRALRRALGIDGERRRG